MNYEYRGVANLHRARTHSSFLLNPFAWAFYYFLLLWIHAQKAISAPELFREETDYVIMEKTVFYQLIWQIQAQIFSSSLVSHLDYCDIPLNLLWFIFPWYQPFKAQAAKHRNEQPLVYQQQFCFGPASFIPCLQLQGLTFSFKTASLCTQDNIDAEEKLGSVECTQYNSPSEGRDYFKSVSS